MNEFEMLKDIESRISIHDGPIDPSVIDSVVLESDYEYGWTCSLRSNHVIAGTCSRSHATPEEAIADLYAQVVKKYPRKTLR